MILKMCEWVNLYEIFHQFYPCFQSLHTLFTVLFKIDIYFLWPYSISLLNLNVLWWEVVSVTVRENISSDKKA